MIRSLLDAASLLTTIPAGRVAGDRPISGAALVAFPLVGMLVGAIVGSADWLFGRLLPGSLPSALAVVVWILLTGGLHLDGWIDVCDGLAPGLDRARVTEVMSDPRVGALGVVGGAALLLVKFSALAALAQQRFVVLVVAAALGRWGALLQLGVYPYGRGPAGLGWTLKRATSPTAVAAGTLIAVAVAVGGLGPAVGALACGSAAGWSLAIGAALHRRLGAVTGDVYGATVESTETMMLILAAGLGAAPG